VLPLSGLLLIVVDVEIVVMVLLAVVELKVDGSTQLPLSNQWEARMTLFYVHSVRTKLFC